jgi:hypothetical protein
MARRPANPTISPPTELTEPVGSARANLVARIDAGVEMKASAGGPPQDWEPTYRRLDDYNRALLKHDREPLFAAMKQFRISRFDLSYL